MFSLWREMSKGLRKLLRDKKKMCGSLRMDICNHLNLDIVMEDGGWEFLVEDLVEDGS